MTGKFGKEPNGMGEKLCVRMRGAAYFFAGHGVTGEKAGLSGGSEEWQGAFGNGYFDAAHVGD